MPGTMDNKADGKQQAQASRFAHCFYPPPLCAVTPATAPLVGETAIILWRDGTRSQGKLHNIGGSADILMVKLEGCEQATPIDLEAAKLIYLPKARQWVDLSETADGKGLEIRPQALDFKVTFTDGDDLNGKTIGFNATSLGLYLFPTHKDGRFFYSFVPHSAKSDCQIGPKIGAQLVEDKVIESAQVESALAEQSARRKKPLGEYITAQALVTTNELERALQNQQAMPNVRLGELLVEEKLITEEQLGAALEAQKQERSTPLGEILIKQGKLTIDQVQHSLARKLGVPFVDLQKIDIDEEAAKLVPQAVAEKHKILPLHIYNGKLVLVMNNPLDWKVLDEARFVSKMEIIPVMASEAAIVGSIRTSYALLEEEEMLLEEAEHETGEEEFDAELDVSDNIVVRMANKIVVDAYYKGASDIHIEPYAGRAKTVVRFRKDGSLINYRSVPPNLRKALVARYKVMAGLDMSERRLPQDGKISFARYSKLKIELRLATIPTAGSEEDLVIRILAGGEPIKMDDLLLSNANLENAKSVLQNPHGLFFVCGPTGSGKTTTLHSLLAHLNTPDKKIWTVEDPVEITQKGVRQVQVNPKAGLNFARALRAFLRADPDIVMVGEMRDKETTEIGIEASLTGHLVLSTLHTNSAVESVVRLLEMGMDPYNFSDALLGVLAQRLAKRLCPECKQARPLMADELRDLAEEYCHVYKSVGSEQERHMPEAVLKAWSGTYADDSGVVTLHEKSKDGCSTCESTGYKGRLGLHEMLLATNAVRTAIFRQQQVNELLKIVLEEGMTTLKQDGILKVLQGYTDLHEVRKVCAR